MTNKKIDFSSQEMSYFMQDTVIMIDDICQAYEHQIQQTIMHYENELSGYRKIIEALELSRDSGIRELRVFKFKQKIRAKFVNYEKWIINSVRGLSEMLGIKGLLKKTKTFKFLHNSGTIDKHREKK